MMTKRNLFWGILLAVMLLAAGCGQTDQPPSAEPSLPAAAGTPVPTPAPTVPPTPTPEPTPTPDPIAVRLGEMTLEEKVGQLFVAGFYGTTEGDYVESLIDDYEVGGLIFYGRNVGTAEELVALMNDLRAENEDGIPLFFSIDQEGGAVERLPKELKRLGDAYDYGLNPDTGLSYRLGQVLAEECRAFGFNLNFAPSLDIWSNPDNTVIGRRAFSSDWERAADCGVRCAYGMMDGGVIPSVKHYPGHGDTAVDSHVGLPVVEKTREELYQCELKPFLAAINGRPDGIWFEGGHAPVPAVMVGHILLTQLDPDRPATLSPAVVNGLLREELGFDGLVLTDDLTMGAVTQNYGLGEAAVLAVEAGCDVLLICHNEGDLALAYDAVRSAVDSGRIGEARIDESVYRILSVKEAYGLSNDPIPMPDTGALNELISNTQP